MASQKKTTTEKTSNTKKTVEGGTSAVKVRKPYPAREERIALADKKISQLSALVASRETLVAATEKKLAERTKALKRAEDQLAKLEELKAHIIAMQNKPVVVRHKLSPEELAEHRKAAMAKARAMRKAASDKRNDVMEKLAKSGLSIDDLLAAVNKEGVQIPPVRPNEHSRHRARPADDIRPGP